MKPRAPEFYVPHSEHRRIIFLGDQALATFHVYRIPNGSGRFDRVTVPPSENLLQSITGLNASRVVLYEVVDIDGFTTRKGTKVVSRRSLWVTSASLSNQIADLAAMQSSLTLKPFKVSRSGEMRRPVYNFFAISDYKLTSKDQAAVREGSLRAKLAEFYAPPSLDEQRAIIVRLGVSGVGNLD